ncbi:MAG: hypothetical protein EOP06_23035 [Proteobacteria bacterium]|nr:MAG: hypothetical protein EOP06_23035 [Pseudomonadota bacterium]
MKYLPHINSPADLQKLSPSQLPEVAAEVRQFIIDTIAHTGGHFGGPLGAVDLCVALHYVFDSPRDKFVWDVGYQAYAHKILTGRRDRFHTLRQKNGIAPFPFLFKRAIRLAIKNNDCPLIQLRVPSSRAL